VICPSRELALQCYEVFSKLNKYTSLTHCLVIGKVPIQKQEAEVRRGPDLIIATPGRIVDLLKNSQSFNLDDLEMLIFDEADKLLSMGFQAEIEQLIEMISKNRQTLLFSATLDDNVKSLVKLTLNKPLRVQANPDHRVSEQLNQQVVLVETVEDREAALVNLIEADPSMRAIIFFKTKRDCHRLAVILGLLGKKICELHGNMSQMERIDAFAKFREREYDIMIATDLASRGLDIKDLNVVINFELPTELTRYIHRIGRTARAGESGVY
jgi:ATP-dependent RNA helicase DDX27